MTRGTPVFELTVMTDTGNPIFGDSVSSQLTCGSVMGHQFTGPRLAPRLGGERKFLLPRMPHYFSTNSPEIRSPSKREQEITNYRHSEEAAHNTIFGMKLWVI